MKNVSIARLAGFGFFGLSFLSPIIEQNAPGRSDNFQLPKLLIQSMVGISGFIATSSQEMTNFISNLSSQKIVDDIILSSNSPTDSSNACIEKSNSSTRDDNVIEANTMSFKSTITPPIIEATKKKQFRLFKTHTHTTDQSITDNSITYTPKTNEDPMSPPAFYIDEELEKISVNSAAIIPIITNSQEAGIKSYPEDLMQLQIDKLKEISISNGYSKEFALMINLGMRSGKKRFYIIDLITNKILQSGLVAHGKGKEKFTLNKTYSNKNGSSCSSLGLYKIGASYNGSFGKSFRLIGLEKSNSNALSRAIVLHSMSCIPDEESDYPICQSEGCPSVSPNFLESISEILKASKEPILLWMFDPLVDTISRQK